MPELDKDFIITKIEKAHRAKRNKYGTILPVIAKFSDWTISEQVKSSFIKAANDKKDETPYHCITDVLGCSNKMMQ